MYSNYASGTICAASDFTEHDKDKDLPLCPASFNLLMLVFVAQEDVAMRQAPRHSLCLHLAVPLAETGWAETSKEFSKHICKLVLKGLRPVE